MINYGNAKIYKIWSIAGDKIYIGSTTKKYLSQRMENHRYGYKTWKQENSSFVTSFNLFEEYGIDNCFIELLEAKVCISKDELKQLEGKYIRSLVCVNKCIAGRTKKEYRDEHKEKIKEYDKKYRGKHKEEIKQYRDDNIEHTAKYNKEYYEENKHKIKEQMNIKFECECGGKYTHCNKPRHLRTTKHCQFINSLQ